MSTQARAERLRDRGPNRLKIITHLAVARVERRVRLLVLEIPTMLRDGLHDALLGGLLVLVDELVNSFQVGDADFALLRVGLGFRRLGGCEQCQRKQYPSEHGGDESVSCQVQLFLTWVHGTRTGVDVGRRVTFLQQVSGRRLAAQALSQRLTAR